jgi:hypothetical protein
MVFLLTIPIIVLFILQREGKLWLSNIDLNWD